MTAVAPRPVVTRPYPVQRAPRGAKFLQYLHTTDPKVLGVMYIATSFAWFMIGGLMALFMRAELARPGMQFLAPEQYNQLFTMHGTIMLLFYATAVVFGFANFVLPLQIGAPDVAFPRLNAFSYWLYFFGAIISTSGFFTPNGAAAFGWTAYPPLSGVEHSPGVGGDLWIMGLAVSGLGTILGGVNMITTVICMRAPGMTMWRLPIFTWAHPGDLGADPGRVPGADGGVVRRWPRTDISAHTSSTRPTAERSSISICSGSSGIPRCTSSPCPSSASFPKCSRSSPENPCSGIEGWSMPCLASPRCPSRCGRTTCSRPAPCCCRSSAS